MAAFDKVIPRSTKQKSKQILEGRDLTELKQHGDNCSETENQDGCQRKKISRILLTILKLITLLFLLYMFICSLDFLSSAFRLLAGRAAGSVFRENELLQNPVCGVMIGVLATVLVQSSSTTTSIVVSMVSAGNLLDVKTAIPILMGANIGTSVTNTIVAMGQITSRKEFRRAFAGATVHDMFNWLVVIVLLPIEAISGYLFYLSEAVVDSLHLQKYDEGDKDLLKALTKPFTSKIVQIDKNAISDMAEGKHVDSILYSCCKTVIVSSNLTGIQTTRINKTETVCKDSCESYLFMTSILSDEAVGAILLVIALVILCFSLFAIVKVLNSLLQGKIRDIIQKYVNADFPGKCGYFTGYLAIVVGCGLTILVQSSSIFTSTMTPLVGVGVITLERMYPLTLGSNIGTTTTAILAAMAGDNIKNSMQTAFCHLFFNISGILLFYPIPYLRFPIPLAKYLGRQTAKYRWFAIAYLIFMFFLFPLLVFGLSLAGWYVLAAVMIPIVLLICVIIVITVLQNKKPSILPKKLQNWKFLPVWCRSLKPIDRLLFKVCRPFCKCYKIKLTRTRDDQSKLTLSTLTVSKISNGSFLDSYSLSSHSSRIFSTGTESMYLSAESVYWMETRNQTGFSPETQV